MLKKKSTLIIDRQSKWHLYRHYDQQRCSFKKLAIAFNLSIEDDPFLNQLENEIG